jgi:hypothetical protein
MLKLVVDSVRLCVRLISTPRPFPTALR